MEKPRGLPVRLLRDGLWSRLHGHRYDSDAPEREAQCRPVRLALSHFAHAAGRSGALSRFRRQENLRRARPAGDRGIAGA
mgnify:CR=1 FL=1